MYSSFTLKLQQFNAGFRILMTIPLTSVSLNRIFFLSLSPTHFDYSSSEDYFEINVLKTSVSPCIKFKSVSPTLTSFLPAAATLYYFFTERWKVSIKVRVIKSFKNGKTMNFWSIYYANLFCVYFFKFLSPTPPFSSAASGGTKSTLITFYSLAMIGAVVAFLLNHRLQHYKTHSFRGVMKAIFNCTQEAGHYY